MGEVYRARDPRLGRDVALKLLSPQFSSDPERLERFEREARALGSLNHPSIAAIYGVEESAGVRALVLELVEGETLAHRLRGRRPLPAEIALRLARQIANALDAAHQRGFIHRDLKPSNVALTRDGDAKLLDFGLTKNIAPSAASGDGDRTLSNTEQGVILGTAAYMSPEQARGLSTDQRADVWAFGCVLYEMLSGRKAFQGETLSDTLSKTLTAEPDWSALPSSTPPGAVHLIRRCLEKEAPRRLRGLGDIDLALDTPMPAASRPASAWIAFAAIALIAAGAAATLAVNAFRGAAPPPAAASVHFEIPISIQSGESGAFALSRDSKRLVFIGTGADGVLRMWERSLNSIETRPISGTEGQVAANSSIYWSPDNQTIGFYADGAVKKISRDGGAPQVVCRVPSVAIGGTWNDRGDIVVGTPSGLLRCPAEGGTPSPLTDTSASNGATVDFFPTFLPDGQHLLFLRVSRADASRNGLYVADLAVTPAQQTSSRVLETGFGAEYVPGPGDRGTILFARSGGIWAIPFLADRLAIAGEAIEITPSVGTFRDSASFQANQRTLVYRAAVPDYQLTWRSRNGDTLGVAGEPGQYLGMALSPDETMAAVARENRLNRSDLDLWLVDLRRNITTRFTTDSMPESIPTWSADSQSLIYGVGRVGHDGLSIVRKRLDGGTLEVLLEGSQSGELRVNPVLSTISASGDGRFLIVSVDTRTTQRSDLWSLPLQGPGKPAALVAHEFDQMQASVSRKGDWLAYVSNETGANEVFARRITTDVTSGLRMVGPATLISPHGGQAPRWRADGRELFYLSSTGQIMAAPVSSTTIGAPQALFQTHGALPSWDVSRDGERFLLAVPARTSPPAPFSVVLNWQSTLPR